jgi:hypothetical protein
MFACPTLRESGIDEVRRNASLFGLQLKKVRRNGWKRFLIDCAVMLAEAKSLWKVSSQIRNLVHPTKIRQRLFRFRPEVRCISPDQFADSPNRRRQLWRRSFEPVAMLASDRSAIGHDSHNGARAGYLDKLRWCQYSTSNIFVT